MCCGRKRTPASRSFHLSRLTLALVATVQLTAACDRDKKPEPTRPDGPATAKSVTTNAHELHEAAASGNLERAREILAQDVDVNGKNKIGRTALHAAAAGGHDAVVKLLVDHGADPNSKDAQGKTPLELVRKAMSEHWNSGQAIPRSYLQISEHLAFAGATI